MKKGYLVLFLFLITRVLIGQNTLEIVLKDSITSEVLTGVTVILNGTQQGGISDKNGYVQIRFGNREQAFDNREQLRLTISSIGYKTKILNLGFPVKEIQPITVFMSKAAETLQEVTISSTRTNSRIEDLPMKIEVLGADDMYDENMIKPGNISSILGDIAGVIMQQTSAVTGNIEIKMQGLSGKYTQILRDGMPIYDGIASGFSLLNTLPLDVKQTEIIKGPSSILYGAGSIAGIVNFISKEPEAKPEFSFTLNKNSLKEIDINTYFAQRGKVFGYSCFAGRTIADAVDVNNDGFSDVAKLDNVIIHPRFFLYSLKNTTINAGFSSTFNNNAGGSMDAINTNEINNNFLEKNIITRFTADYNINYKANNFLTISNKSIFSEFNSTVNDNGKVFKGKQLSGYSELTFLWKLKHHNIVTGLTYRINDFKKLKPDTAQSIKYTHNTVGVFFQDDWCLAEKFILEYGIRYDYHNIYKSSVLPKIALLYKYDNDLNFRLNWGEGYFTPSIFDQSINYFNYNKIIQITDALKPERSYGINFDINYHKMINNYLSIMLNQTFFYTKLSNPVISVDSARTIRFFNDNYNIESKGGETYCRLNYKNLEVYLGYSYSDAEEVNGSNRILSALAPLHKFSTIISYDFNRNLRIAIESSQIGRQSAGSGEMKPAYWMMAAMIEKPFKYGKIVLNCENLLDYRQTKTETLVYPPYTNPTFSPLWSSIEGRVVNLALFIKI